MAEVTDQRRFRFSIGTLMIAVALCALLLAALVWMIRHLELRVTMERIAADNGRAQAERALYVAQLNSAQAALNAAKPGSTNQPKTGSLWAAVTVNHSTFKQGKTKDLRIEFSLVNDGDKVIDPKIAASRIVINGKELADSEAVFGGVPKDVRFRALSRGEGRQFDVLLGDHFKEPGAYRVSWKGTAFQSSEIVLRILHEEEARKPGVNQ
jgi:hypothetical protein